MKPFRIERVSSEIRALVSDAITNRLSDPRIAPLTSVTRVGLSRDLEQATVFVSVFGDEGTQRRTIAALAHARGFIQTLVARSLDLRQCPHIEFELDSSIKKEIEVNRLIDEAMAEIRERESHDPTESAPESGEMS